ADRQTVAVQRQWADQRRVPGDVELVDMTALVVVSGLLAVDEDRTAPIAVRVGHRHAWWTEQRVPLGEETLPVGDQSIATVHRRDDGLRRGRWLAIVDLRDATQFRAQPPGG